MKTILITGGAGFIGSVLTGTLADQERYRIVVSDWLGKGEKWRNLSKHAIDEIVPPPELMAWLDRHKDELEALFHLGGVASTVEKDVDALITHNFVLSAELWRWCAQHHKRFIYASSSAVYGNGKAGFDDDMSVDALKRLRPLSGHGWSKQLFDLRVARAVSHNAVRPPQWAGLRFFSVYGPNEYHKENQRSVIGQLIPHALRGHTVKLFRSHNAGYPDGGQKRDFIYVKDCVSVLLWLLENPSVCGMFNVGTGQARSFNDLAAAIFAALGKPPHIHYIDMPEDLIDKYQYFTEAKIDRLRAAGYDKPFLSLEEGIKDFVLNYMAREEDPYF